MDGAGDPPPRGERRRALRRPRGAHRRARPAGQRARPPAPGRGARRGRRGRRGARARRAPRPAARRALHRQGGDRGRRACPSPNGSRLFADHVDDADAVPLRRLRDAGAILLGKTNVPEFCAHWDTYNELFGATANPHDVTRSAGGSSGGEAAALASAMTRARPGLRLRRLDPLPRALLRRVRPAARTRHGAVGRPPPDGQRPGSADDGQRGPAGALRRRPRAGPRGAGAARAGGRRRRPASRSSRRTGCSRWPRRAARRCGARPTALGDAGHDVVEARPPGQAEVRAAFDTVLAARGGERDGGEPGRPRGRALAADPRDARCAARLRARAGALHRGVRAAAGPGARGRRRGSSATAPRCARWRPTSRRRCAGASVPWTASPCARAASSRCARTPARSACRPWRCRWRARRRACRSACSSSAAAATSGRCWRWRASSRRAFGGWLDPDAAIDRAVALDRPGGPREGRGVTDQPATQDRAAQPRRRRPDPGRRGQLRRHPRSAAARGPAGARAPPARLRQRGPADRGGVVRRHRLPHPHRPHHRRQAPGVHPALRHARALDAGRRHQPPPPAPAPPSRPSSARSSSRARRPSRTATTSPTARPGTPCFMSGHGALDRRRADRRRAARHLAGRRGRLLRRPVRGPRRAARPRAPALRRRGPLLVLVGPARGLPDPDRRPGGQHAGGHRPQPDAPRPRALQGHRRPATRP